ncbi:MAG: GNAT family N-acetyltransferase [Bacteroidaceae bacterium]|nr:GNAT family N-acetyltransferase [Bacteroidaceae bacterium]
MSKSKPVIQLVPLEPLDRNQFVLDNQEAFKYGATEEFGLRDDHFEEDGEIISRDTIEHAIDEPNAETYRIGCDGQIVGGVVIRIDHDTLRGDLDLLFVSPHVHSRGIGYAAWCEVERMHPEVKVWETMTPYFEKRNIHFYVNRCKFHIVEFYCERHQDPNYPSDSPDEMFRFEKVMV